ncbi:hypothetical protein M2360_003734 [Rhizobium sp. SG_E_25_P2]|uniref:hypothetical protein n=1 Tax=Rhizobium sp. SG_E_25_P2 TaxID=2879942 RepID=UPI0024745328|nr:hypothetical protein [Rhizobium sp. SG_E_25_P2]MDH6268329.1 hypothetical protein [Rhizobium sp. SG_E_25_P2]
MLKDSIAIIKRHLTAYLVTFSVFFGLEFIYSKLGATVPGGWIGQFCFAYLLGKAMSSVIFPNNTSPRGIDSREKKHFQWLYPSYFLKYFLLMTLAKVTAAGFTYSLGYRDPDSTRFLMASFIFSTLFVSLALGLAGTWLPAGIGLADNSFLKTIRRAKMTFPGVFFRVLLSLVFVNVLIEGVSWGISLAAKDVADAPVLGKAFSVQHIAEVITFFWLNALFVTYIAVVIARAYLRAEQSLSPTRHASASPMDGADGIA